MNYDHIAKILNELRDYTKIHFQHEEEYMKSINYKGMFMQKVQHDQFCQKLDELDLEHLDENSEEVIQEVLTFLTDWLGNPILEKNKIPLITFWKQIRKLQSKNNQR